LVSFFFIQVYYAIDKKEKKEKKESKESKESKLKEAYTSLTGKTLYGMISFFFGDDIKKIFFNRCSSASSKRKSTRK